MNGRWTFLLPVVLLALNVATSAQTDLNTPPPLPVMKSPVDLFRELLNSPPAEREKMLADRPGDARARLLEKVREYQTMDANERELKLRATELRWWLLPLMRLPAGSRAAHLSQIPGYLRPLVESRLQVWDLLPPALQTELLDQEYAARIFTRVQNTNTTQLEMLLKQVPVERQQQLRSSLNRWAAMSDAERSKTAERFDHYFELDGRERAKVLNKLSDTERQQMEQALQSFEKMPSEKRLACVRSFQKFASMSPAERLQFLKNAERWEQMPPVEREKWRRLVRQVPEFPPLPPGFEAGSPPLPPALPNLRTPPVTNGGG